MTAKRETTGPAAKLVLRPDRREISADGRDVAILTVEVQDAQGRIVPVTDNQVTLKVTGPGEVIGTGNGDPTNHEPDGGFARKAFAGLCMAMVQSGKTAGSIGVEATSPGLTSSTATINSKAVKLRPQVAVWEREVPTGTGITGLWRPASNLAAAATNNPMALAGGNVDMIFTLRQNGKALTGTLESAAGGGFGGGGAGGPIQDGKVDGSNVSFRVGMTTYTGTVNEDPHRVAEEWRLWGSGRPRRGGDARCSCWRGGSASGNRSAAGRHGPIVWRRFRRRWKGWRSGAAGPSARDTVAAGRKSIQESKYRRPPSLPPGAPGRLFPG